MKRNFFLLLVLTLTLSASLVCATGEGGPVLMLYNLDFGPINGYLENTYDVPPLKGPVFFWGGAGTHWPSDTFGIGMVVAGGIQSTYKDNRQAKFNCLFALLQMKSILRDGFESKLYAIYGPGLVFYLLRLNGNTTLGSEEYFAYNMRFYIGLGYHYSFNDALSMEARIGLNVVPERKWDSKEDLATSIGNFAGGGISSTVAILFGG